MLWRVDSGRKVLCICVARRRGHKYLGHSRRQIHFPQNEVRTGAVNRRAAKFHGAHPESGRAATLCRRRSKPGRTDALRQEVAAVLDLPFRHLRRGVGFLPGWRMADLCRLPRSHSLAQPSRWQPAASTHLSSHGSGLAAVVPRRQEDRFLRQKTGRSLEDLCSSSRSLQPRTVDSWRWPGCRPDLVSGWKFDRFRRRRLPRQRGASTRFKNAPHSYSPRVGGSVLSALVTRRSFSCCLERRFAEATVVPPRDPKVGAVSSRQERRASHVVTKWGIC